MELYISCHSSFIVNSQRLQKWAVCFDLQQQDIAGHNCLLPFSWTVFEITSSLLLMDWYCVCRVQADQSFCQSLKERRGGRRHEGSRSRVPVYRFKNGNRGCVPVVHLDNAYRVSQMQQIYLHSASHVSKQLPQRLCNYVLEKAACHNRLRVQGPARSAIPIRLTRCNLNLASPQSMRRIMYWQPNGAKKASYKAIFA